MVKIIKLIVICFFTITAQAMHKKTVMPKKEKQDLQDIELLPITKLSVTDLEVVSSDLEIQKIIVQYLMQPKTIKIQDSLAIFLIYVDQLIIADGKKIKFYDLKTGKLIREVDNLFEIHCMGFNSDKTLISALSRLDYTDVVRVYYLESGQLYCAFECDGIFNKLSKEFYNNFPHLFSGKFLKMDRKQLEYYVQNKTIYIKEKKTDKIYRTLEGHDTTIVGIALTKDERFLVSASDRDIKIWTLKLHDMMQQNQEPAAAQAMPIKPDSVEKKEN